MTEDLTCGLVAGDRRQIPLEGLAKEARLAELATEVTVAQRYRNREPVPVEAVYVFPLEEGAAVCAFEARIGDHVVRGRVAEREKAFEIYDDAMAEGHGAFLLDQERPDVFTASVGNLRPGESVEIRITYVALARHEGSDLRLTIPGTVSPRYVPADVGPEVGQPDAERVNPERWLSVPYGLELRVDVETASAVRRVESPSHPVSVETREKGAVVTLARERAALDRDFVLLVATAEPHRPSVRVAGGADGDRFCQLTFLPDLSNHQASGSEVLFLLDCSGSMIGDSIDQARRALALSIRALEEGDTFNVVRFGSKWKSLWRRPRPFDERTLEEATAYIENAEADLGGTEIMAPLRRLLELRADPERRRQILLLTDGEVTNEREIVHLAEEHASTSRIFTFGIGAGSSEYLVRELARVSRGAAEMIFPGERIEPKVLRMFGRVRNPALDEPAIDWGGLEVEQAPTRTPPVFAGDTLTVFGRVVGGESDRVVLRAGDESWELALDLDTAREGGPVPALWARELLRELERGTRPRRGSAQRRREVEERRRRRLVELGERYGLLSSATSYVAVEERSEGERSESPAELRKIPIALTVGWGGIGGRLTATHTGGGGAFAPMSSPMSQADLQAPVASAPKAASPAISLADGVEYLASGMMGDLFGKVKNLVIDRQAKSAEPRRTGRQRATKRRPSTRRDTDRLYALLMTQKADGSFRMSPTLEKWLGSNRLAAIEDAVTRHGEAVVATAVVIGLLGRDEASREDQWRPAIAKARKWLARQDTDFEAGPLLEAQDPVSVVSR